MELSTSLPHFIFRISVLISFQQRPKTRKTTSGRDVKKDETVKRIDCRPVKRFASNAKNEMEKYEFQPDKAFCGVSYISTREMELQRLPVSLKYSFPSLAFICSLLICRPVDTVCPRKGKNTEQVVL